MPASPYRARLRSAIDRQGISIRALAKRMDPVQPERARRNLHNWLADIVPSPRHRAELASLLDDTGLLDGDDEEEDPVAALYNAVVRVAEKAAERAAIAAVRSLV